jgi:PEGA domain
MKTWKIVGPVVLVALSLMSDPALAQRRGGGRSPGGGGGSRAVPRGPGGGGGSRAVPRSVPYRSGGSRVVVAAPYRSYSYPYYSRPYYAFRPRVSVGFGLYVGYPVAFPYFGYGYGYSYPYRYGYGYPYPYTSYPYPYAYSGSSYPYPDYRPSAYPSSSYPSSAPPAAQGSIGVGPGTPQGSSGGISFDITPNNAQVYVEGQYAGLVSAFSPTSQPLTLAPGRHHVEIRLVGYQTMTFETEVTPGQVVPYQGTMQR